MISTNLLVPKSVCRQTQAKFFARRKKDRLCYPVRLQSRKYWEKCLMDPMRPVVLKKNTYQKKENEKLIRIHLCHQNSDILQKKLKIDNPSNNIKP